MSDVLLYQSINDGEVNLINGDLELHKGILTAAYLSLFGGNKNDGGFDDATFSWWANLAETDPARQYRSETQYLLETLPLTSAGLLRIEDAAKRDLQWFIDNSLAKNIRAIARVPTVDRLTLTVYIDDLIIEYVENL